MRRHQAKLPALLPVPFLGDNCYLHTTSGQVWRAGTAGPWLAECPEGSSPKLLRKKIPKEATFVSRDKAAAEESWRSFFIWLKAAAQWPEATTLFCLCPKPIMFTQEMQLAVSPAHQLFEYQFLIVLSAQRLYILLTFTEFFKEWMYSDQHMQRNCWGN